MKRIVKWLSPLLFSLAIWSPAVHGQAPAPSSESTKEERVPAVPYTMAFAFTMLVLVIICTPSRKPTRN